MLHIRKNLQVLFAFVNKVIVALLLTLCYTLVILPYRLLIKKESSLWYEDKEKNNFKDFKYMW